MIRQLVLKEIIPKKPRTFNDRLNEIILSLDLPKYPNKKGNKQFTTAQRVSVVILYIRSQKSLRDFCEYFNTETKWPIWLELKYNITKSSINRWLKELDLDLIKEAMKQTNSDEKPEVVGIDGTGIDTKFKSTYYQKRLDDFGQKSKANWHKLDIIANMLGKKKVLDFQFSLKQVGDVPVAWKFFKRFKFENVIIVADKGYFCFDLFRFVESQNNYLLFPPKNYRGKCRHNNLLHRKFKINYHKYIDIYHKRSNVEGVFSALKRTILNKIVSRKCSSKKREMALKLIIYNMKKNVFQLINLRLKNYLFI